MIAFSESQIAQFHREGFIAIDAITTPDEIEHMRVLYDELFAAQTGREAGDHFDLAGTDEDGAAPKLQQMLNPSRYAPAFDGLAIRRNALALAAQLLGPGAEAQGDHAILKPAGHGVATPWHQDEAYWNPELSYNALSVWVPLQEATLENGCMQFIPESHRRDVLPHHSINHDPRIHGLEVDEAVDAGQAIACPLPAGGATFHLARTLHYAGPNRSTAPRRAYIMMFGTPPVPNPGARRFPWLEARQTAREARAAGQTG